MTTEEKAKAYDETIKKAKEIKDKIVYSHLSTESCKAVSEYIDTIIPELKESEDERIREKIRKCILYDCSLSQEETDEMIAYLEKQKENPKTVDSIPSNCVSDAKCEDRWYKVADFLPDSGRDVLAKDALGNYLLASFDGDQWFVNVYDGEDKPIVYTPAIKEWCDIPSEKQKEPHYTKRNALFDKCVAECDPAVMKEVSDEIDEMLGKEQKPAEWSDNDDQLIGFIFDLLNDLVWRKDWAMSKEECLERLKSIRPSWKPSEEHFQALRRAIMKADKGSDAETWLIDLCEQLKKLM